jgi:hypothetical protein
LELKPFVNRPRVSTNNNNPLKNVELENKEHKFWDS